MGEPDKAMGLFNKSSGMRRYSPYPSWELGRAAQKEEDWNGSIPHLENALERYPTSPRIRLDLAQAYYQLGDYRTTIQILEEVKRYALFDPEAMRIADRALHKPETPEGSAIQGGTGSIQAR
jgi:tetratricopeptide (TPR) repeat protein